MAVAVAVCSDDPPLLLNLSSARRWAKSLCLDIPLIYHQIRRSRSMFHTKVAYPCTNERIWKPNLTPLSHPCPLFRRPKKLQGKFSLGCRKRWPCRGVRISGADGNWCVRESVILRKCQINALTANSRSANTPHIQYAWVAVICISTLVSVCSLSLSRCRPVSRYLDYAHLTRLCT